ncbi:hypothetical protein CDC53_20720 [Salmonella enterica subsp. enterica serovar Enteritidis]|nr:hypothetical protein CDC53_20720 [Salmonella enterica subsp. enterica serovar Enteritidis]
MDRVLGYEPSGRRFDDEDADKIVIITAGTRKDNVASATAHKANNPPGYVTALQSLFPLS